jgi:hypothetical protein
MKFVIFTDKSKYELFNLKKVLRYYLQQAHFYHLAYEQIDLIMERISLSPAENDTSQTTDSTEQLNASNCSVINSENLLTTNESDNVTLSDTPEANDKKVAEITVNDIEKTETELTLREKEIQKKPTFISATEDNVFTFERLAAAIEKEKLGNNNNPISEQLHHSYKNFLLKLSRRIKNTEGNEELHWRGERGPQLLCAYACYQLFVRKQTQDAKDLVEIRELNTQFSGEKKSLTQKEQHKTFNKLWASALLHKEVVSSINGKYDDDTKDKTTINDEVALNRIENIINEYRGYLTAQQWENIPITRLREINALHVQAKQTLDDYNASLQLYKNKSTYIDYADFLDPKSSSGEDRDHTDSVSDENEGKKAEEGTTSTKAHVNESSIKLAQITTKNFDSKSDHTIADLFNTTNLDESDNTPPLLNQKEQHARLKDHYYEFNKKLQQLKQKTDTDVVKTQIDDALVEASKTDSGNSSSSTTEEVAVADPTKNKLDNLTDDAETLLKYHAIGKAGIALYQKNSTKYELNEDELRSKAIDSTTPKGIASKIKLLEKLCITTKQIQDAEQVILVECADYNKHINLYNTHQDVLTIAKKYSVFIDIAKKAFTFLACDVTMANVTATETNDTTTETNDTVTETNGTATEANGTATEAQDGSVFLLFKEVYDVVNGTTAKLKQAIDNLKKLEFSPPSKTYLIEKLKKHVTNLESLYMSDTETSKTLITSTCDTWILKTCIAAFNKEGGQDPSGFYEFLTYTTGNIDASACYTLANKDSVCAATESESSNSTESESRNSSEMKSLDKMNMAITLTILKQSAQCSLILEGDKGIVSLFNKAVKTSEQTTKDSPNTQHFAYANGVQYGSV